MPRDLPRGTLTSEYPAHEPLPLALEDLHEAHAEGVVVARLADRLRDRLHRLLALAELEREAQHVPESQPLGRGDAEAPAAHVERVGRDRVAVRPAGLAGDGHECLYAVVVATLDQLGVAPGGHAQRAGVGGRLRGAADAADAAQVRELEADPRVGEQLAGIGLRVLDPQQEAPRRGVLHAYADARAGRRDQVHGLPDARTVHGRTSPAMSFASAGARPPSPRET